MTKENLIITNAVLDWQPIESNDNDYTVLDFEDKFFVLANWVDKIDAGKSKQTTQYEQDLIDSVWDERNGTDCPHYL